MVNMQTNNDSQENIRSLREQFQFIRNTDFASKVY